jgi:hypothetical protein
MRRIGSCSRTCLTGPSSPTMSAPTSATGRPRSTPWRWASSVRPIRGRGAGPGVASAPVRRGDAGGAGACAEPIRRVRRFGRRRRGPITVIVSLATAGVLVRLLARPPAASSTRPLARAAMASGTGRRGRRPGGLRRPPECGRPRPPHHGQGQGRRNASGNDRPASLAPQRAASELLKQPSRRSAEPRAPRRHRLTPAP